MADTKITIAATLAFGEMFYTPYLQSMLWPQRAIYQRNARAQFHRAPIARSTAAPPHGLHGGRRLLH